PAKFVLVRNGHDGAALGRTIFLEARAVPVCVVDLPAGDPRIADEAASARSYVEASYDSDGVRYEPFTSAAAFAPRAFPLGPDDTLLVTGGAKGIGAECAIEAARLNGCRLALLGSSPESANPNVARMRQLGLRVEYHRADVTDAAAVRS